MENRITKLEEQVKSLNNEVIRQKQIIKDLLNDMYNLHIVRDDEVIFSEEFSNTLTDLRHG